ncbi:transmembrane emp24 domain-containing protein 7 isoform X1 [Opisthocomus hoazin]|uniref:transmembrane emp24 domain-containing protein 7 isoform X1 n=1 Tax=Opisthocomus hoazin TaxID=30419 RepID=UPI003F52F8D1
MLLRGSGTAGLWGSLTLLLVACAARASEITFELPDNAKQCFYEEIVQGTKCTLEFQVITGGHYDVDCRLEGPDGAVLYKEMKKQYDSFTFTASRNGTYKFCFSNEFSTFTHKTVYFDFQVGEDPPLFPSENRATALTQLVQVPLDGIPSFWCINRTTQLGVICKLAEGALDVAVHVIDKYIEQHRSQYGPLRDSTRHWSPSMRNELKDHKGIEKFNVYYIQNYV